MTLYKTNKFPMLRKVNQNLNYNFTIKKSKPLRVDPFVSINSLLKTIL